MVAARPVAVKRTVEMLALAVRLAVDSGRRVVDFAAAAERF
jgi:hypothetical protein